MKEIITYDVYIDDDSDEFGVDKLSLVKKPAIMEDFIWMDEDLAQYRDIKLSEEKRIITGPALIPDIEIIRKDEDGEPYYIKYSEQQIETIVQKFFKEKDQYSVNKDHKADVSGVWMYESWIVGDNDKSKDLGFDVPKGTWMVSMKVDDEDIWQGIKSGKYRGFSIEGLFKFKRTSKFIKQRKLMRRVNSSNVERVLFNDLTGDLAVKFHSGDVYVYKGQNKALFDKLIRGEAVCKTAGENEFGRWWIGKTPSVGAAVWDYLSDLDYEFGTDIDVQLEDLNLESIKDYPQGVREAAKRALAWAEKNGWGGCGTSVGKQRANQLAKGEPISPETVKRMHSFLARHRGQGAHEGKYGDGCGRLMYDAWGGEAGFTWSRRIAEKLELEDIISDDKKNKNINMTSAITKSGMTFYTDAEKMDVGVEVYSMTGEEKNKIEAGEYEFEDFVVVVDDKSTIAEIKEVEVEAEDVEAGMGYKKDKEDKDKNEEQDVDGYDAKAEFEALKGMMENISMKLDMLLGSGVEQSIVELKEKQAHIEVKQADIEVKQADIEVKLEKITAEEEMKAVETIDDKKEVQMEGVRLNKKAPLDYNIIKKMSKKF
jgi:hypothetical protein